MKHLKFAVMSFARYLGVNAFLRNAHRNCLTILCYHGVVSDDRAHRPLLVHRVVGESEFDRQMDLLRRLFRPVSVDDLVADAGGRSPLPERAVLVTFDDGYRNNLTRAAPILERRGVPALFNVATGYIGGHRPLWTQELEARLAAWPHPALPMPASQPDLPFGRAPAIRRQLVDKVYSRCKSLPDDDCRRYLDRLREVPLPEGVEADYLAFLSWHEVRELNCRGFAIGSHTVEHPILTRVEPRRVESELRESKAAIEKELQRECTCFAYPNGGREDFSPEIAVKVREAGYQMAFTLTGGSNSRHRDHRVLDRINIPGQQPECVFHSYLSGLSGLLHGIKAARRCPA